MAKAPNADSLTLRATRTVSTKLVSDERPWSTTAQLLRAATPRAVEVVFPVAVTTGR